MGELIELYAKEVIIIGIIFWYWFVSQIGTVSVADLERLLFAIQDVIRRNQRIVRLACQRLIQGLRILIQNVGKLRKKAAGGMEP